MRDLIYYVFYRTSKFYKLWGEKNTYYISGKFLLFLAICSNILTFIVVTYILAYILHMGMRKVKNDRFNSSYIDKK